VSVTGLTAATAYHYRVKSRDAAGNEAPSGDYTFTTIQVVQIQLAEIPAGTFTMGEVWLAEPVHQVIISKAFYMGLYEVTQGQYKQLMGTNPSYFVPTQTAYSSGYSNTDNQPVEQVSWFDSVRFCNAISLNQGLTPCYTNQRGISTIIDNDTVTCNWSANGYRLPTEAEWEYACRGGTTSRYYWGSSYDEAQTKQYCWFGLNANGGGGTTNQHWTTPHADKGGTQPVGTKLPNAFGLYDMNGNVLEWCYDWYGDYSASAQTDPNGATTGSSRVLRGGSWYGSIFDSLIGSKDYLGSAYRESKTPTYRDTYLDSCGFRVCRNKQ
jgi:formylglycine-generating enzyme required for sulfatase activity